MEETIEKRKFWAVLWGKKRRDEEPARVELVQETGVSTYLGRKIRHPSWPNLVVCRGRYYLLDYRMVAGCPDGDDVHYREVFPAIVEE